MSIDLPEVLRIVLSHHMVDYMRTVDVLRLSRTSRALFTVVMSEWENFPRLTSQRLLLILSTTDCDANYMHSHFQSAKETIEFMQTLSRTKAQIHPLVTHPESLPILMDRMACALEHVSSCSEVHFCQFTFEGHDEVRFSQPVGVKGGSVRLFIRKMSTLRSPLPCNVLGIDLMSTDTCLCRVALVYGLQSCYIELRAGSTRHSLMRESNTPTKRGVWTDLVPCGHDVEISLCSSVFIIENSFIL
jgi:hypothetical protein